MIISNRVIHFNHIEIPTQHLSKILDQFKAWVHKPIEFEEYNTTQELGT